MRQPIPSLFALTLLAVGMLLLSACGPARAVASNDSGDPILTYPPTQPTPTIAAPAPALADAPVIAPQDLLNSWQVRDLPAGLPGEAGRWLVREGYLAQDGIQPAANLSSRLTMLLTPVPAAGISAAFYDQYNGTAGLIARASAGGFYRLLLDRTAGTFTLERVVDGVPSVLTSGSAGLHEDRWHTISLVVAGDRLTATLDGQELAVFVDPSPLPAGSAGIVTRALGGILFDQIALIEEN